MESTCLDFGDHLFRIDVVANAFIQREDATLHDRFGAELRDGHIHWGRKATALQCKRRCDANRLGWSAQLRHGRTHKQARRERRRREPAERCSHRFRRCQQRLAWCFAVLDEEQCPESLWRARGGAERGHARHTQHTASSARCVRAVAGRSARMADTSTAPRTQLRRRRDAPATCSTDELNSDVASEARLRSLLAAGHQSEFEQLQLATCLHVCAWHEPRLLAECHGALDALRALASAPNLRVRADSLCAMWNLTADPEGASDFVHAGGVKTLAQALVAADEQASTALAEAQRLRAGYFPADGIMPGCEKRFASSQILLEAAVATARNLSADASVARKLAAQTGVMSALLRMASADDGASEKGGTTTSTSRVPLSIGRLAAMRRDAAMVLWQLSSDAGEGTSMLLAAGLAQLLPSMMRLRVPIEEPSECDVDQETQDGRYAWQRAAGLATGGVDQIARIAIADGRPGPTRETSAAAAPSSAPTPGSGAIEHDDQIATVFAEAFEDAVAVSDEVEAQRTLVQIARNIVCDESGAEELLQAGLVRALMPWLPPKVDAGHADALVPLKCIELVCSRSRWLAAKAALAGAVPPALAVLKQEVTSAKLACHRRLPESLLPATRALWHMAQTRHGLAALVRAGGLHTILSLQRRTLRQSLRMQLLELGCAVLDGECEIMRAEGAVQSSEDRKAWLDGASAARAELHSDTAAVARPRRGGFRCSVATSAKMTAKLVAAMAAASAAHGAEEKLTSEGGARPSDSEQREMSAAEMAGRDGEVIPAPHVKFEFNDCLDEIERLSQTLLAQQNTTQLPEVPSRVLRLLRTALTHLASGELPPDTPHPWHEAEAPPAALMRLLTGPASAVYADAAACIGLLAMEDSLVPALVGAGAVEALVSRVPASPNALHQIEASMNLSPTQSADANSHGLALARAMPPWRADEAYALQKNEELRLQTLAALRQLVTRVVHDGSFPGSASDVVGRFSKAGGTRMLIAQMHDGQISPFARGEAALTLDALCEMSQACEMEVFRSGASARLAEAVTDVLRARPGGLNPRRDAMPPWLMEQNESPFDT